MKNIETKITLSGLAGTGKTTIGKILAQKLNYEFISVGDFSRKFALEQYGLNINEFQEKCKKDPALDQQIDEKFQEYCNKHSNLVIDYRLGFKFVQNAFNVLLQVSDEVASHRIQNANRQNENLDPQSILNRNTEMKNRFLSLYGVDFTQEQHYHLSLSTDNQSPEELAEVIIEVFKQASLGF